ncbi:hypothetical protein [Scytonema sp. NUACC26]|uniref:hypothetical protein n=1 Tax=Scytonema sp. NUACC26 TaxID=3140176 RepID=UPI0034DC7FF3
MKLLKALATVGVVSIVATCIGIDSERAIAGCNPFGCSQSSVAECNPFGCPQAPMGEACTPFGCPSSSQPQLQQPVQQPVQQPPVPYLPPYPYSNPNSGGTAEGITSCIQRLLYRPAKVCTRATPSGYCYEWGNGQKRTEISEATAAQACQNAR